MPDIRAEAVLKDLDTGLEIMYFLCCDDFGRFGWWYYQGDQPQQLFGCGRDAIDKSIRAIQRYADKPGWSVSVRL